MKNKKSAYTLCLVLMLFIAFSVCSSAKMIVTDAYLSFEIYTGSGEVSVDIGDDFITRDHDIGQFEELQMDRYKIEADIINKDKYTVETKDGITRITLKEDFLKTFKDGRYYMTAEFENAEVPLMLFVVTEKIVLPDAVYDFKYVAENGNAIANNLGTNDVRFFSALFEKLTLDGKEVDKSNYSVSEWMHVTTIHLNADYVKTFAPGEYTFTAQFMNADTTLKLKIHAAGDVNGDGTVNAADARLALRASAKLEELSDMQKKAADVDSKDGITAADARKILRAAAKLDAFVSFDEE